MTGSNARSKRKSKLEPISLAELAETPGMSGFCTFLTRTADQPVPALDTGTILETPPVLEDGMRDESHLETPPVAEPVHVAATPRLETAVILETPPVVKQSVYRTASPQIARRFQPLENARLKKAVLAQDGHTMAEQIIYSALYSAGEGEASFRDVAVGNRWIMARTGLSERTVQLNLKSLQLKLSIEIIRRHNPDTNEPTLYRVYSFESILERRRAAGFDLVARKRGGGVRLVRSETPPVDDTLGVIGAAVRSYGAADEPGIRALVDRCHRAAPDITADEIVYLIHQKLAATRLRTAPLASLLVALPASVQGDGLGRVREQRRREQETARQEDIRLAREILARPAATAAELTWAQDVLANS